MCYLLNVYDYQDVSTIPSFRLTSSWFFQPNYLQRQFQVPIPNGNGANCAGVSSETCTSTALPDTGVRSATSL